MPVCTDAILRPFKGLGFFLRRKKAGLFASCTAQGINRPSLLSHSFHNIVKEKEQLLSNTVLRVILKIRENKEQGKGRDACPCSSDVSATKKPCPRACSVLNVTIIAKMNVMLYWLKLLGNKLNYMGSLSDFSHSDKFFCINFTFQGQRLHPLFIYMIVYDYIHTSH